jgi:allantoinase
MTPEGDRPALIWYEDGRITAIDDYASGGTDAQIADMGELCLIPGLVDTHVHVNEPGRTDWEGFETATRAAAAGGITCLVDMPLNSIPATVSAEALQRKRESAAGKCSVDYAFWGGVVPGNSGELESLAASGVRGFKCFLSPSGVPEFENVGKSELREAMPIIAKRGLPLLVHAELPEQLHEVHGPLRSYADYLKTRPDEAETAAISLLIELCREFRCHVHIVHLASAAPLQMIAEARAEGLALTVETCPHYLHFVANELPDGATELKCAPPIRCAADREALWDGLRTGLIDMVATDHSPCPPDLKRRALGDFAQAWGGIASLSIALSVVNTGALRRGICMSHASRWMAERPAKLAGLETCKGRLDPGCDADFVVFDPDAQFTVTADDLYFRHAVTPYLGKQLRGRVVQTYLRGEMVFENGEFIKTPFGREVRR